MALLRYHGPNPAVQAYFADGGGGYKDYGIVEKGTAVPVPDEVARRVLDTQPGLWEDGNPPKNDPPAGKDAK